MEMETMKGDSTSLRRELEEERVDLQDKLARIESEKSALQKGVNKFDQTIEPGEERKNALTVPPSLNEEVYVVASRENFIKSNCFSTTIQFAYTGRYPPFLKIIPRRLQTPVNEIFDFTSLVQTTAMIFTDPNLLPKIRNRAPERGHDAHNARPCRPKSSTTH
ncbi:hypothetical protein D9758_008874 [Tetrapyrgos nigripes]|uniref:Uncharacterized protein n=1 Tax=Tetrapyrgos nigripes TaxID=182062 RepID=A0A8H5CND8_9AGAR|nr:hypothetical protein D9758_008874 [Tetrapyrgos nigripes]